MNTMIEKYALFKVIKKLVEVGNISSVRELARMCGVGVSTASLSLDYLFSKNIVKKTKVGKNFIYAINTNSILARYIKILFSINAILDSKIVEEIIRRHNDVISIVLYGSVARGDDDAKSDIDILIISRKKIGLKPFAAERKIGREMTFLAYTYSEWKEKAKSDKPFYDNVILYGIALHGEIPAVI